ncbi:MAG: SLBB domain-containing protein, partial [Phycisphaerae bacterium]|nr:SLBB domain-containing protein [Phycisphaerae bacterium]
LRVHIPNPSVDVSVAEARNYRFTIYGDVRNPGVYTLSRPDFDVIEAVSLAGGVDPGTKRIRIVRVIQDAEDPAPTNPATPEAGSTAPPTTAPTTPVTAPSIDDLINQIAPPKASAPVEAPIAPPADPPAVPPAQPPVDIAPPTPIEPPAPAPIEPAKPETTPPPAPIDPAAPGVVRATVAPIDIEPLQAPTSKDLPVVNTAHGVQTPPQTSAAQTSEYVFDVQKQEWVLVSSAQAARIEHGANLLEPNSPDGALTGQAAASAHAAPVAKAADFRLPSGQKTRIIEIDWERLRKGDMLLNAIIRPDDKVYVEVDAGVVYIDGEVARPGVYSLPSIGEITLSRLVSAAGGLGQIAIPQRVDLIRKISPDREAAIRVNLAAIRNRAEPDVLLRADDHIIIGTNFFATPLAVIRNGFRMTYGFGFLLDRNFGNDVFGPPPESNPFN